MPEFTDAQIETSLMSALDKRDLEMVPKLLKVLALQNPERAEELRQTIMAGLTYAATHNAYGMES